MPKAILTPRATLKWPSRHKHRVYCDIEEALLNIDRDENSTSHGGRHTGRGVRLTFAKSFMGENRRGECGFLFSCEAAGGCLAFA
jgi:hypothetical protein